MCGNICEHGVHCNEECKECKRTLICPRCKDCYVGIDTPTYCNGCDDEMYGHGTTDGIYENTGKIILLSNMDRTKPTASLGFEANEDIWDITQGDGIEVFLSKDGKDGFYESHVFDRKRLIAFMEKATEKLKETRIDRISKMEAAYLQQEPDDPILMKHMWKIEHPGETALGHNMAMKEAIKEARADGFEKGKEAEHKIMGRKEDIPDKCEKCGGRLNIWIGSHTAVRSVRPRVDDSQIPKGGKRIIYFEPHWFCTKCFLNDFKSEILKEGADRARENFKSMVKELIRHPRERYGQYWTNNVLDSLLAELGELKKAEANSEREYKFTWVCPKCSADKLVLTADDYLNEYSFYCEGCNTDFRKEGFWFSDKGQQSYNKGYRALCAKHEKKPQDKEFDKQFPTTVDMEAEAEEAKPDNIRNYAKMWWDAGFELGQKVDSYPERVVGTKAWNETIIKTIRQSTSNAIFEDLKKIMHLKQNPHTLVYWYEFGGEQFNKIESKYLKFEISPHASKSKQSKGGTSQPDEGRGIFTDKKDGSKGDEASVRTKIGMTKAEVIAKIGEENWEAFNKFMFGQTVLFNGKESRFYTVDVENFINKMKGKPTFFD